LGKAEGTIVLQISCGTRWFIGATKVDQEDCTEKEGYGFHLGIV
jgi:hypothetical protein